MEEYYLLSTSSLNYLSLFFLRPISAIIFVLSLLLFGWFLAWKLVLVHVPLVQEIFGLRKKPVKPKPENRRRFTQFYNDMDARSSASIWKAERITTAVSSLVNLGMMPKGNMPCSLQILPCEVWLEMQDQST
nr:hypothetical protein DM860_007765 [Ipomoea batatas]GMD82091.1 hypothetical protein DM860_007765 [Ipomoea batatas]